MSTIKEILFSMRKLREAGIKGTFRHEDNTVYCPPEYAAFIAAAPTNQARLEKALEIAVEALQNAELSFMGMGNATIAYGLPSKPEELIAMCEDRSKRIQSFFADIEAALSGDEK